MIPIMGERARSGKVLRQKDAAEDASGADCHADPESPIFDELNRKILEYLQEDGRAPFSTIARQLNTSEGTIRNRVQRMKEAGALQIAAIIDPMAIHYKVDAMIGLNVATQNLPRQVANRLAELEQITFIFWVAGRFDLLVEVVCGSDGEFRQFIEDELYSRPDVLDFEVMSGIEMFKNQFILRGAIA
tara:strand:- start:765 stop:1328 length:564 start_codon:yes stop_codon:yes gene_type:complete